MSDPHFAEPDRAAFVAAILARADHLREFPWRDTRDGWAVLVSETMLQQTQTSRVVPRYRAFVERYPAAADCAAAPVGEVIARWQGLGYNRRAVHLHRAAVAIVADHDGVVPADLHDLMALPGVGPYTARAVAVFAHERHHGVVDTNVARVLARAVRGGPLGPREVQSLADELVPAGRAWDFNQAIMEHGATTCTKRAPRCDSCVVLDVCAWRVAGGADPVTGTAFTTTPQSSFAGSDRQGRGRLVTALADGPVPRSRVAEVVDWEDDPERVDEMLAGVLADGLAVVEDGLVRLPC